MRIYLSGISEDLKELQYTESDAWLLSTIRAVEEAEPKIPGPTPQKLRIDVYSSQDLVILKGRYKGSLTLLCSRCADPFTHDMQATFQCLFTKDKTYTEKKVGIISSSHWGKDDEDGDGTDIEFLDKEYLELSEVVREQLYLKLPLQPLCKEECKGLCATCGQNQNSHACQCHRLRKGPLAAALQNIKLDHHEIS